MYFHIVPSIKEEIVIISISGQSSIFMAYKISEKLKDKGQDCMDNVRSWCSDIF